MVGIDVEEELNLSDELNINLNDELDLGDDNDDEKQDTKSLPSRPDFQNLDEEDETKILNKKLEDDQDFFGVDNNIEEDAATRVIDLGSSRVNNSLADNVVTNDEEQEIIEFSNSGDEASLSDGFELSEEEEIDLPSRESNETFDSVGGGLSTISDSELTRLQATIRQLRNERGSF